jgi:hypothetical protein
VSVRSAAVLLAAFVLQQGLPLHSDAAVATCRGKTATIVGTSGADILDV